MRQPKRFVIAGAILATALLSTGAASGVTAWKQFGNAAATGRGNYGNPYLDVESTTGLNPEALQFVVTAPSNPVQTGVHWNVDCWNRPDSDFVQVGGSFYATPPITKVITEVTVADYNYCELDVLISTPVKGGLKLSLQAQCP
jgi:hypothetical protein